MTPAGKKGGRLEPQTPATAVMARRVLKAAWTRGAHLFLVRCVGPLQADDSTLVYALHATHRTAPHRTVKKTALLITAHLYRLTARDIAPGPCRGTCSNRKIIISRRPAHLVQHLHHIFTHLPYHTFSSPLHFPTPHSPHFTSIHGSHQSVPGPLYPCLPFPAHPKTDPCRPPVSLTP